MSLKLSGTELLKIRILICLIPFLMGLAVDLYVPSLPLIVNYFHSHQGLVQYSISLYMSGYGVGQLFLGVLSDCYGRRWLLRLSAVIFIIASIGIIIVTPNIYVFNLWRFLQGFSIAGLAVIGRAMLVDVFSGRNLYIYTNYFSLSWSLGPILGPFIGGYLQHYLNWQADFIFFALYGVVIFFMCFRRFPETNVFVSERTLKISLKNTLTVLTSPLFILTSIISSLIYGVFILFNTSGPFIIQNVLKLSPLQYGNIALVLGLCYFVGTLTNRILIVKYSPGRMFLFGINAVTVVSIIMMVELSLLSLSVYLFVIPIGVLFYLVGFVSPNTFLKTMSLFQDLAGTTSSVYGAINGLVVSAISYFAGLFEIRSGMLIALSYLTIFVICILLALLSGKIEAKNARSVT